MSERAIQKFGCIYYKSIGKLVSHFRANVSDLADSVEHEAVSHQDLSVEFVSTVPKCANRALNMRQSYTRI